MRQHVRPAPVSRVLTRLAAVIPLLAINVARADTRYTIQSIVRAGDKVGDLPIRGPLAVAGLTDSGQLVIVRHVSGGGVILMRYAEGKLTPLVVGGQDGSGGKWHTAAAINSLVGINRRGSVAFSTQITLAGKITQGTFLYNGQTGAFTTVALAGMPAGDRLFQNVAFGSAAVNNHDEVAFGATVSSSTGTVGRGIFFLGRDGRLLPVALPDGLLPDGSQIARSGGGVAAVSDAGAVGLRVFRAGDPSQAAAGYLWENGVLTPVARAGGQAPGGDTIANVFSVRVNNRDRNVLVVLYLSKTSRQAGLYRWVEGQLVPAAVPGQELPGGGTFQSVAQIGTASGLDPGFSISASSEAGEVAFMARLEDNSLGVYRLDAAGKLALVLKDGASTELGKITLQLDGSGRNRLAINSQGQVALNVKIDGGPETIVLLTPTAP